MLFRSSANSTISGLKVGRVEDFQKFQVIFDGHQVCVCGMQPATLLRKLHDAPPKVNSSGIDERPAEGTGFPHFAPNLF